MDLYQSYRNHFLAFFLIFQALFSPVTGISSGPKVQFCRIHWKTNLSKLSQNPKSLKCKSQHANLAMSSQVQAITRIQHRGNFVTFGTSRNSSAGQGHSKPGHFIFLGCIRPSLACPGSLRNASNFLQYLMPEIMCISCIVHIFITSHSDKTGIKQVYFQWYAFCQILPKETTEKNR